MKNTVYLMMLWALVSCKETKSVPPTVHDNNQRIDTISNQEVEPVKSDTLIRKSKPFELNTILCYWENYIINNDEIIIHLKTYDTNKILIENPFFVADLESDYTTNDFFNYLNNEFFIDLNFDGYKDFKFYSKGSLAMTSLTNIYLFNSKTKSYDYSDYLSAISIDEIDLKKRKLVTSSFDRESEIKKIHYFDKNGKIRFSEIYTLQFSEEGTLEVYEKIVDGKVVETKKSTK